LKLLSGGMIELLQLLWRFLCNHPKTKNHHFVVIQHGELETIIHWKYSYIPATEPQIQDNIERAVWMLSRYQRQLMFWAKIVEQPTRIEMLPFNNRSINNRCVNR